MERRERVGHENCLLGGSLSAVLEMGVVCDRRFFLGITDLSAVNLGFAVCSVCCTGDSGSSGGLRSTKSRTR